MDLTKDGVAVVDVSPGQAEPAVVITVIRAAMGIHELMGHERLVSDIGIAHELRHRPGGEIELGPHAAAVVADIVVVEQVLLGVVAIVAIAQGVVLAVSVAGVAAVIGTAVHAVMVKRMSVGRAGSAATWAVRTVLGGSDRGQKREAQHGRDSQRRVKNRPCHEALLAAIGPPLIVKK